MLYAGAEMPAAIHFASTCKALTDLCVCRYVWQGQGHSPCYTPAGMAMLAENSSIHVQMSSVATVLGSRGTKEAIIRRLLAVLGAPGHVLWGTEPDWPKEECGQFKRRTPRSVQHPGAGNLMKDYEEGKIPKEEALYARPS